MLEIADYNILLKISDNYPDPIEIRLGDGLIVSYPTFKTKLRLFLFMGLGKHEQGIRLEQVDFACQISGAPEGAEWCLLGYFKGVFLSFVCNGETMNRWRELGFYDSPRDTMDTFVEHIGKTLLRCLGA